MKVLAFPKIVKTHSFKFVEGFNWDAQSRDPCLSHHWVLLSSA